jgi:asparagine synthetase B (glutamine-hydrolysing)
MCGIGCIIAADGPAGICSCPCGIDKEACLLALQRRGPDRTDSVDVSLPCSSLLLMSSVLHLRGTEMCAQPAQDAAGNVLLWNGEVLIFTPLLGFDLDHLCSLDDAVLLQ